MTLLRPLERHRPRHPHSERSQGRVRETAVTDGDGLSRPCSGQGFSLEHLGWNDSKHLSAPPATQPPPDSSKMSVILRGSAVKFLGLVFLSILLCSSAKPQARNNWPHPPPAADESATAAKPKASPLHAGADSVELQRQAKELLELSQSLQPDMQSVNHGLLPTDTIDKLKRIEKLSKRMRGELGQ